MTQTKDHPAAIRSAAQALARAIVDGRAAGFAVAWPSGPAGLEAIAVSETGRAKVDVTITTTELEPAVAARAGEAARKAADRTIEKAG
jgi:hypothetical protein